MQISKDGNGLWLLTGFFLVITAFFSIPFSQYLELNPEGDFRVHVEYANTIHSLADIKSPHFGFEIGVIALRWLGVPSDAAGVLLVSVAYGAMAVMVVIEIGQRRAGLDLKGACAAAVLILLACQINLFTAWKPNLYFGYFAPLAYHNPGQQLMKAAGLAVWFLYVRTFLRNGTRVSLLPATLIVALSLVSALCKPSFLIVFVPCVGLLALFDLYRRNWRRFYRYLILIVTPSVSVLLCQYWFAYGAPGGVGIGILPFEIFPLSAELLIKGVLSLAFPIFVGLAFRSTLNRLHPLVWAYVFLAIAMAYTFLLVETGPRMMQGNFAWSLQIGVFLVYVESALVFLQHIREATMRRAVGLNIGGLHVVSGLVLYVAVTFFKAGLWV